MRKFYTLILAAIAMMGFGATAQDFMTIEGMTATYSWEGWDYDGADIQFAISIKADKAENGVVINGMFGKYEVKGTFSTDDGSITIPNQRVGFDAEKGQFVSFVHLDYDDAVDGLDLVLDNSMDGDLYTFEGYGVVAETMDGEYLTEDGFLEYGYMAFIYRTGELDDKEWEDAGVATLFDGGFFTPLPRFGIGFKTPVELPLEKSTETEGVYRLVNPWSLYFGKEYATYLEFDISDPDCVIIPTQETGHVDEEYGMASVQNFVGMYVAQGFGKEDALDHISAGKENEHICTYNDKNKVVTMPVNSTFTTFAKDPEGYWNVSKNYGATDSYIVMPGGSFVGSVVADDDAQVEYYNLQGMRVAQPAAGQLVIRRQGGVATKVVM